MSSPPGLGVGVGVGLGVDVGVEVGVGDPAIPDTSIESRLCMPPVL